MANDGYAVFLQADDGTLRGNAEDREKILKYRRLFEIHEYYDSIKPFTFRTEFVDVSVEDAQAWREYNRGGTLTTDQQQLLDALKERTNKKIQEIQIHESSKDTNSGVFIRLSTRSPKDAVDKLGSKLIPIISQYLKEFKSHVPDGQLTNFHKLIAIRKAFFDCMKVKGADEAFELIMYSSRAISDMKRLLDNLELQEWDLKLVVREFVNIPIELEFRGFVNEGSLNALSQYYADCFFPELPKHKDYIQKLILDFFEQLKPHINVGTPNSYIVDFVVLLDLRSLDNSSSSTTTNSPVVKVVELNPFSESTGACLFDWKKDKEIIDHGPFTFRVVENPSSEKYYEAGLIPWKSLLQQAEQLEVNNNNNTNPSTATCSKETSKSNSNCAVM